MTLLYYLQTNITCVVIMLLLLYARSKTAGKTSIEKQENLLIYQGIIISLADILSWAFNNLDTAYARVFSYAGNMIYYIVSCTILFGWLLYVNMKTGKLPSEIRRVAVFASVPLILFTLLVLTTPYTKLIFYVDSENAYHRGSLVYLHWLVAFSYLIASDVIAILRAQTIGSSSNKNALYRLCYFGLFPLITTILQIFLEGSSMIPVGITISLILFFTRLQNDLISIDSLTGINNRSQLGRFLNEKFSNEHSEEVVFMIMIDINDFKGINDTYGHLSGDEALIEFAQLLKRACGKYRGLFLSRYGGDEFAIVGIEKSNLTCEKLIQDIELELTRFNTSTPLKFPLSISAGSYKGSITNLSINELIRRSDESMYKKKKSLVRIPDGKTTGR